MKFAAEDIETVHMISVFVGEQDAIKLFWSNSALSEAKGELSGAQPAVNQQPTMISRDKCAVSRAAASEHRQTKHSRLVTDRLAVHKWKCANRTAANRFDRRY